MFPYYLTIKMNDEPFTVHTGEDFVSASDYLHPRNYMPTVAFAIYGLNEAKPEDDEDMSMEELVEKGYAEPLVGFQGTLFLAKDLFVQGFSPRAYIEEVAPSLATIPEFLLSSQDLEEDLLVEETPNLFIIERMDILSPAVFEVLAEIVSKLQLTLLSLYHATIQVLLFPTPPLQHMIAHDSMQAVPEFHKYLKSITQSEKVIYVEEWGKDPSSDENPSSNEKPVERPTFSDESEEEAYEYRMLLSSLFLMLDFERADDPKADFLYKDISSQMDGNFEF